MLLRLAIILPMACCGIFIAVSSFSTKKGEKRAITMKHQPSPKFPVFLHIFLLWTSHVPPDDSLFSYHPAFMSVATMLLLPLSISIIASGRSTKNATNHAFVNFVLGM